jgi:hypothetical protein
MKRLPGLLLFLLVFGEFSGANAQGSGVHTKYMKDDKTTVVETFRKPRRLGPGGVWTERPWSG